MPRIFTDPNDPQERGFQIKNGKLFTSGGERELLPDELSMWGLTQGQIPDSATMKKFNVSWSGNIPTLTPDQYQQQQTLQRGSEFGGFTPNTQVYGDQAKSEISPYYKTAIEGLTTKLGTDTESTKNTYTDLLDNLSEDYNRRGTFFGGGAIQGEQKMVSQEASDIAALRASYNTNVAGLTSEEATRLTDRAAELKTAAYNDFLQNKDNWVNEKVLNDLSTYAGEYGDYLAFQAQDDSSFYLDIPLEDNFQEPTTGTPSTSPAPQPSPTNQPAERITPQANATNYARGRGVARDGKAEQNALGEFTKIFGHKPNYSNPADQAAMNMIAYGYGPEQGYVKDQGKEAAALKTFQAQYGHNPSTPYEWNIIHSIAYSGATKR